MILIAHMTKNTNANNDTTNNNSNVNRDGMTSNLSKDFHLVKTPGQKGPVVITSLKKTTRDNQKLFFSANGSTTWS